MEYLLNNFQICYIEEKTHSKEGTRSEGLLALFHLYSLCHKGVT